MSTVDPNPPGIPDCYIRDELFPEIGKTELFHLHGVPWWKAHESLPKRHFWQRHKHVPQTVAYLNWFTRVCRCACGDTQTDDGPWKTP